ncbi:MAG: type IV pilus assembly protein PilM [Bacillota bacterium]|nr:type IV pilus assembly protein PilM [Bacillota bacterium]
MALQFFSSDFMTIDIGFRYIKIIQLRKKKNNDLMVVNYGIGDTPRGCIKNGAIKDKVRVVTEIKRVIDEHSLSAKEAKIVISGTNIITRIIMVEKVEDKDVDKKVWSEIHNFLPINFDEHRVDYKLLDVVNEGGQEKMRVFVTAVAKNIINSYIEIIKELKLKPVSVDIPANSISKFFQKDIEFKETDILAKRQKFPRQSTNTVAVIDLGSETTIVNILKNKIPEFNRVILQGSSNIDQVIIDEILIEKNQADKAERYKKMYGMVAYRDPNNDLEWQCSECVKKVINEIAKNIKMCFNFYVDRCGGEQISKIFLVGGGSKLKGIREYFEEAFGVPTYPINYVDVRGIEFAPELNIEKINYLINAIGIAL